MTSAGRDIIVVTVDSLRADALASYGGRSTGLALDRWAQDATVFERHYSVATSTLMSLYTWYSGIPPHAMPIQSLATAGMPAHEGWTLGEILHRAGYRMLTTVEKYCGLPNPADPPDRIYRHEPIFALFDDPPFPSHLPGRPDFPLYGIASEAVPYALDWLRRTPGKRFLHLWVTDLHVLHRSEVFRSTARVPQPSGFARHPDPIARRYYDVFRVVDQALGRFLDEAARLTEDALIIVNADHGEELGEKAVDAEDDGVFVVGGRLYDHGYATHIENTLIQTPLIVRAPGLSPGRVTGLVSAVDFFPTVVGFAAPAHLRSRGVPETWRDWTSPARSRERVFAHTRWFHEVDRTSAMITQDGWKLVRHAEGQPELYRLPFDPRESANLWSSAREGPQLLQVFAGHEAQWRGALAGRGIWTRPAR